MTEETADDLSAAEYKVRVDGKIVIEPKEDIKERLGRSPGKGDALLLTFAFPVSKRLRIPGQQNQQGKAITDYDPMLNPLEGIMLLISSDEDKTKPAHRLADCDMSRR